MKMFNKIIAVILSLVVILLHVPVANAIEAQVNSAQNVIVVYKNELGKDTVLDQSVEVNQEFSSTLL